MKRFLFLLVLVVLSCDNDDVEYQTIHVAKPITQTKADLRAQISIEEPRAIKKSGKFYFYEDLIFVNDSLEGIHIIDNSNPQQPQKKAFVKVPNTADIEVKDNLLYVDSFSDLVVFNIQDLDAIKFEKRYEDVFFLNNIYYPEITQSIDAYNFEGVDFENEIIIGWEYYEEEREVVNNGQVIEDFASDAGSDGAGQGGSYARFKIVGDHLYVVDLTSLLVFELSDTEVKAQLENQVYIGWDIETIFNQGEYLYLGSANGMYIYNISNPDTPQYVSEIRHLTGCDPVVVDGDYAYLTLRGGNVCGQNLSFLEVIDISNKEIPKSVLQIRMQSPYGLGVHQDKLFVSDGKYGLHIYDKTIPETLDLLTVKQGLNIFDIIPLQDKLLMIGNNMLYQYAYGDKDIHLISTYDLN